jgi:cytochrome d ubiquinol oxidase subunit II
MTSIAFGMVVAMIIVYVVLDGYDLGVGTINLLTRDRRARADAIAAIGPYWSGNEVWLVAVAGLLFALFPRAYASLFSGFYLPFMVLLWLLMLRGCALELRDRLESLLWQDFWDVTFAASSTLLALVFGVALGNIVHGFPLHADGFFAGSFTLLLNPYALAVGAFAVLALARHGLAFLAASSGGVGKRAMLGRVLWGLLLVADIVVTTATVAAHPLEGAHLIVAGSLGLVSLAALVALGVLAERGRSQAAFVASCAFLTTALGAAAATIYPSLVPAAGGTGGITIFDAGPSGASLGTMLVIAGIALAAVVAYSIVVHVQFRRGGPP